MPKPKAANNCAPPNVAELDRAISNYQKPFPLITLNTIDALARERARQRAKFGKEPLANELKMLSILGEEFGEICRAINQGDVVGRDKEVLQVAAVCIAWLQQDLHWGTAK